MTSAASYASPQQDTPLERVRLYVELFTTHFCEFFRPPPRRFIERALHAKACAFLRGLEALVRRVLTIEAAALLPTLPPARAAAPVRHPKAGRSALPKDAPRPPAFQAFRQPFAGVRSAAAGRPAPASRPAMADLRPLARRYEAIMHALDAHTAKARRLAFHLRGLYTADAAPQIIESPRLHPEHVYCLARDLDILREDANEALRAAIPEPIGVEPLRVDSARVDTS